MATRRVAKPFQYCYTIAKSEPHTDCLFCGIAQRKIDTPGIFWEDENYMAFLSIFPNTPGFSVVIPKQHYYSDVLQMPDDVLQEFILVSKNVAEQIRHTFDDVGRVGLMMEGTGVNHAHIKLFPMHHTQALKNGNWQYYGPDDIEFWFNEYEGWFASADGPEADPKEISSLAQRIINANK